MLTARVGFTIFKYLVGPVKKLDSIAQMFYITSGWGIAPAKVT